ncbi:MAG: hypothetical protein ABJN05_14005 [Sulfitobacter dubius]
MSYPFYQGGIRLPAFSKAERNVAKASSHHCIAHTVLGEGDGCRMQGESLLELCNLLLLNAMLNVASLQEQVRFRYGWDEGEQKQHIFDVVATLHCGSKIAFAVKPEVRLASGRFLEEMQEIAWWVREKNFVDDVRIMSEADVDPVDLSNAKVFAAVRPEDPVADKMARAVVSELPHGGGKSLQELTLNTGMSARGYRALIRLLRTGYLRLQNHEIIKPQTIVVRCENDAGGVSPQFKDKLVVRPNRFEGGSEDQKFAA